MNILFPLYFFEVFGLILSSQCLGEAAFVCGLSNCFAYGTGNTGWRSVANAAVLRPRLAAIYIMLKQKYEYPNLCLKQFLLHFACE